MLTSLPQSLKKLTNKLEFFSDRAPFINLIQSINENSILISIGIVYFLTTYLLEIILKNKIIGSLSFYYLFTFNFVIAFFLTHGCLILIFKINKIGLPNTFKQTLYQFNFSKRFFNFTIIYLLFPIFFCSYSSIKQAIPYIYDFKFKHDIFLSKIDYFLHNNTHPWELLQPIFGYPIITIFLDRLYIYWGIIFFFSVMYMATHQNSELRKRFFLTLCLSWIFIGNILATILFSAGPCYYSSATGIDSNPYSEQFFYLESIPGLNAIHIQEVLWSSFTKGIFMPLGGISAMPSMHVAIATLLALLYINLNKFFGIIMIIYALFIQIGSVHLGWHYAIDGYVSSIMVILLWHSVKRISATSLSFSK